MIPYGRQKISAKDIEAVTEALQSDFLTQGPRVSAFEQQIAAYCGARHCAVVSNGTVALHLAVLAAGIGPGDSVLVPSITFLASANAVEYVGARPLFVDIDAKTYNLDLNQVEWQLKNDKTIKAIIPVDFGGLPVAVEDLHQLAERYQVKVIEDACHAFGSDYREAGQWKKTGASSCSDVTVFSFHPVKHLTTGEGGALLTNDTGLFEKICCLRTHGMKRGIDPNRPWYYEMEEIGYNYRITDLQCALGLSQLVHIDPWVEQRRHIARTYDRLFQKQSAIQTPVAETKNARSSFHLYIIQTEGRDALYHFLRKHDVAPQIHYMPVHLQPYYRKKYGTGPGQLPRAEAYAEKCISLPCYVDVTEADCEKVADLVIQFCHS